MDIIVLAERAMEEAGTSEPVASELLSRMRAEEVEMPEESSEDYQGILVRLAKLLDLLPTNTRSVVYTGHMIPFLRIAVLEEEWPVKKDVFATQVRDGGFFKVKEEGMEFAIVNFLIGKGLIRREAGTGNVWYGSRNVMDLINFFKLLQLDQNKLDPGLGKSGQLDDLTDETDRRVQGSEGRVEV